MSNLAARHDESAIAVRKARHGRCFAFRIWFVPWSRMTLLRIVIPLYLFDLSMIFSENRYPLFRIML
jgi:hypothetical protein